MFLPPKQRISFTFTDISPPKRTMFSSFAVLSSLFLSLSLSFPHSFFLPYLYKGESLGKLVIFHGGVFARRRGKISTEKIAALLFLVCTFFPLKLFMRCTKHRHARSLFFLHTYLVTFFRLPRLNNFFFFLNVVKKWGRPANKASGCQPEIRKLGRVNKPSLFPLDGAGKKN